jgi:hypothetical protein
MSDDITEILRTELLALRKEHYSTSSQLVDALTRIASLVAEIVRVDTDRIRLETENADLKTAIRRMMKEELP